MLSPFLLLRPISDAVFFFFLKDLKTEKQHLDFIKTTDQFLLAVLPWSLAERTVLTDIFQKSLGSPEFKLAHDIRIGSFFFFFF